MWNWMASAGGPAQSGAPAVDSRMWMAQGCGIRTPLRARSMFLDIAGDRSRGIRLVGNDLSPAKIPYRTTAGAQTDAVGIAQ